MASAADIATVRRNTDEPTDANGYTDAVIGGYVDAGDVSSASATIWREKAGKLVQLSGASVTEGGASHKYGDLQKAALAMADHYDAQVASAGAVEERPTVSVIERTD